MRALVKAPRVAVVIVALLGATQARSQGPWQRVAPGIEYSVTVARTGRDSVRLNVVRVNPAVAAIRFVPVYRTLRQRPGAYGYTLGEIVDALKPAVAINGGFSTSFAVPLPSGLLKSDGRIVSGLDPRDPVLAGVLCISGRAVKIVSRERYRATECQHALQAGPLLVAAGRAAEVGGLATGRAALQRSVAGVDRQGRVFLLTAGPVGLDSLAAILTRAPAQGGFGLVAAINLSGSSDAGLVVRAGTRLQTAGLTQSPIASAIIVR